MECNSVENNNRCDVNNLCLCICVTQLRYLFVDEPNSSVIGVVAGGMTVVIIIVIIVAALIVVFGVILIR